LNHKSETVRIRLRGLEAFVRWVVASLAGVFNVLGAKNVDAFTSADVLRN
jgi:hypothetical protein